MKIIKQINEIKRSLSNRLPALENLLSPLDLSEQERLLFTRSSAGVRRGLSNFFSNKTAHYCIRTRYCHETLLFLSFTGICDSPALKQKPYLYCGNRARRLVNRCCTRAVLNFSQIYLFSRQVGCGNVPISRAGMIFWKALCTSIRGEGYTPIPAGCFIPSKRRLATQHSGEVKVKMRRNDKCECAARPPRRPP